MNARSRGRRIGLALVLILTACASASPAPSGAGESAEPARSSPPVAASESAGASATSTPVEARWAPLSVDGPRPGAREDHTWTVTPDGATGYLFGGRDGSTVFGDLWAFDLSTDAWQQLDLPDGPPARFGHNAAWVDGVGLVVFAGQSDDAFFNDVWAFDPAADAWAEQPTDGSGPVPRYGSCAAVGPDGRLWISHGFTSEGTRFADTWAYDFAVDAWTEETPGGELPVSRCLHGCWWTDAGGLVLYAGTTTGITALGDLWRLSVGPRPGTNAWARLSPPGGLPPDRNLYAATRWGDGTLVFGGQGLDGARLSDTWWLDDASGEARLIAAAETGPAARSGAELITDPDRGRVLLFGGTDGSAWFGDAWQLTLGTP
ncbi:MAG TPA: kelch repeat-containing protein [Candidatus Limnocylindria bacterium]|nr:kelch repeat-containing protein [Candidatus Limnocylindria bacterium]